MIKLQLISSLGKIFPDIKTDSPLILTDMLENEKFSFQLEIWNDNDEITSGYTFYIDGVDRKNIAVYKVEGVPSVLAANKNSDDYYLRKDSGLYPDLLLPISQGERFVCPSRRYTGLWFTVSDLEEGSYPIKITVKENGSGESATECFTLNVIGVKTEKNDLKITTWLYHDCIAQKHNVKLFTSKYYRVFAKYLENYVSHGNTMIMVPLFTPPLNVLYGNMRPTVQLVSVKEENGKYSFDFSELKTFLDFVRGYGIECFEFSHLFSQWGAKYAPKIIVENNGVKRDAFGWAAASLSERYISFLEAFLPCLIKFLKKEAILDKCFFHISDEPNVNTVSTYSLICKKIKHLFAGRPIIDALSEYEFCDKGLVDIPVVAINKTEPFAANNVSYWTYYCWEQSNEYVSNRMMSMPSLRERILGVQLYKNCIKGFLHWGFNYYNTAFSEREIDPFFVTDCDKKFPSGDAFLVYPDICNGGVYTSIRNEVFYDAVQDYCALKTAESMCGRETVESIIEEFLRLVGFKQYERSDIAFQKFRTALIKAIAEKKGYS